MAPRKVSSADQEPSAPLLGPAPQTASQGPPSAMGPCTAMLARMRPSVVKVFGEQHVKM